MAIKHPSDSINRQLNPTRHSGTSDRADGVDAPEDLHATPVRQPGRRHYWTGGTDYESSRGGCGHKSEPTTRQPSEPTPTRDAGDYSHIKSRDFDFRALKK